MKPSNLIAESLEVEQFSEICSFNQKMIIHLKISKLFEQFIKKIKTIKN